METEGLASPESGEHCENGGPGQILIPAAKSPQALRKCTTRSDLASARC